MALTSLTRSTAESQGKATVVTLADLNDAAHKINTYNKYDGKLVKVTTENKLVMSAGSSDGAVWHYTDGTLAATPV